MDLQLKQRLVGISVIFALAVIFLPMILDGSGQHLETLDVKIPVPPRVESRIDVGQKVIELKREVDALPEMTSTVVDEVTDAVASSNSPPQEVEQTQQSPADDTVETASESKPAVEEKPEVDNPPIQPASIEQKTPVGGDQWVIQTGSFHDKDKAYRQRDQLRKSKLSAVFIEKFSQNGKLSYKVRMGPFLTREEGRVVMNKVLAKYNIKGWLIKYEK